MRSDEGFDNVTIIQEYVRSCREDGSKRHRRLDNEHSRGEDNLYTKRVVDCTRMKLDVPYTNTIYRNTYDKAEYANVVVI